MSSAGRKRSKRYDGTLNPIFIGLFFLVLALTAASVFRFRQTGRTPTVAVETAQQASFDDGVKSRTIYPLSVIHGGAYTQAELTRARKTDAVVKAHYADFGTAPAFRKLPHDAFLYVSYRRANQVYWSRTKHLVHQGETVITDGNCMARARCGNRLSAIPQGPVGPKEPEEEVLNTPETPDEPLSYKLAELPGPAGWTFDLSLPASLPGEGTGPAALAPSKGPGGVTNSGARMTAFAPGPGGAGGGAGPVPANLLNVLTSTPAPISILPVPSLPLTTTGGNTLPTSPNFPAPGQTTGTIPSGTPVDLSSEPSSAAYFVVIGLITALSLSRRVRSVTHLLASPWAAK